MQQSKLCILSILVPISFSCVSRDYVYSEDFVQIRMIRVPVSAPSGTGADITIQKSKLSEEQLSVLKGLTWTRQEECWEDYSFQYTLQFIKEDRSKVQFLAPNWSCDLNSKNSGTRYISEEDAYKVFKSLSKRD